MAKMVYADIEAAAKKARSQKELWVVNDQAETLFWQSKLKMTNVDWVNFTKLISELHPALPAVVELQEINRGEGDITIDDISTKADEHHGEKESSVSLYSELIRSGIPVHSHETDLYVEATEEVKKILSGYPTQKSNATIFTDQINGKITKVKQSLHLSWNRKRQAQRDKPVWLSKTGT